MKKIQILFIVMILICGTALGGCGAQGGSPVLTPTYAIEIPEEKDMRTLVKNVIQIGDSFEFFPLDAEGHLLCTVNKVWVVREESQCPPKEKFLEPIVTVYEDGVSKELEYDEWFTEGGAFDLGARLLMVDLTVTNVDAVAWTEADHPKRSMFDDAEVFTCDDPVHGANMSRSNGGDVFGPAAVYCSRLGEFRAEDTLDTVQYDPVGIRIPIGETVSYTLGYLIPGGKDGGPEKLSMQWLKVGSNGYMDTGIFIDTALKDE